MIYRLLFFAAALFSAAAWSSDFNMRGPLDANPATFSPCERLLDADLSGHYVVTNLKTRDSSLIQLRRLGGASAYAITTVRINLAAHGELLAEASEAGWAFGNGRVNVLSMDRLGSELGVRFEDASSVDGQTLAGRAVHQDGALEGNVLRPDVWTVQVQELDAALRFTRVNFERDFGGVLSPSLKSMLAERLEGAREVGPADYVLVLEVKRPMTVSEACSLLNRNYICSLDVEERDTRYYRFAMAATGYELLENLNTWLRQPDLVRIDSLPAKVLSPAVLERIIARRRSVLPAVSDGRPTIATFETRAIPPRTAGPATAFPRTSRLKPPEEPAFTPQSIATPSEEAGSQTPADTKEE